MSDKSPSPLYRRSGGVILHPTSLPSRHGIGDLGPEARRWLDALASMGQRLWQILPLGPTSYGDSPYQCLSTFAGNPLLISLDDLAEEGILSKGDLDGIPGFPDGHVDYGPVIEVRMAALELACVNFRFRLRESAALRDAYEAFTTANAEWLDDYALFRALKDAQDGRPWTEWPRELALRDRSTLDFWANRMKDDVENVQIRQFLFHYQWSRVREFAQSRGVSIIGDIPIFVAHDSADVWSHPELFTLRDDGQPSVVAGVPPDYFAENGQRWGNPLYRWDAHRDRGYDWWIARLRHTFESFDIVRIDHFRGFAGYWEIPGDEETAVNGHWEPGPGAGFFEAVLSELGDLPIVAEDLGIITPDVHALRDRFGFPGMRVLQFAFGTDSLVQEYLPENYPENCVAYTGTHDNDTTMGWFQSNAGEGSTRSQDEIERERGTILNYTKSDGSELNWDFIRLIYESRANLAVVPLQDILGLGSDSRMNLPGEAQGNWNWRFRWEQIDTETMERLRALTEESGRA